MQTLHTILRRARQHAGLTQEQAAQKLGVRRSTIGNYEHGRSVPNIMSLYKLCEFYRLDFFQLTTALFPEDTADSPVFAFMLTMFTALPSHARSRTLEWLYGCCMLYAPQQTPSQQQFCDLLAALSL